MVYYFTPATLTTTVNSSLYIPLFMKKAPKHSHFFTCFSVALLTCKPHCVGLPQSTIVFDCGLIYCLLVITFSWNKQSPVVHKYQLSVPSRAEFDTISTLFQYVGSFKNVMKGEFIIYTPGEGLQNNKKFPVNPRLLKIPPRHILWRIEIRLFQIHKLRLSILRILPQILKNEL